MLRFLNAHISQAYTHVSAGLDVSNIEVSQRLLQAGCVRRCWERARVRSSGACSWEKMCNHTDNLAYAVEYLRDNETCMFSVIGLAMYKRIGLFKENHRFHIFSHSSSHKGSRNHRDNLSSLISFLGSFAKVAKKAIALIIIHYLLYPTISSSTSFASSSSQVCCLVGFLLGKSSWYLDRVRDRFAARFWRKLSKEYTCYHEHHSGVEKVAQDIGFLLRFSNVALWIHRVAVLEFKGTIDDVGRML